MLLSDEQVKSVLSEKVVPAWTSIRPVPKVKIDFGDGRILERTLKGNCVLYLCNSEGQVLDAFPGVYTPSDFLAELKPALEGRPGGKAWHDERIELALRAESGRITASKAAVESPILAGLGLRDSEPKPSNPGKTPYERLIGMLEDESDLPRGVEAFRFAGKGLPASNLTPEQIAERIVWDDSRRNVRLVRPAVHLLLAQYVQAPTMSEVQRRIFAEILKVKIDDPYLGLGELTLPGTPPPDEEPHLVSKRLGM